MKPWHEAVGQYLRSIHVDLSRCQLRDVCDALYATKSGPESDWFDGIDGPEEEQARFHEALRVRGWNEESIQANFGAFANPAFGSVHGGYPVRIPTASTFVKKIVALNQAEAMDQDWWA